MRRAFIALILAAALATLLAGAGAAPAGTDGANGFAGSCEVKGAVRFSPPVTNSTRALRVVYDASGQCSGRLNGRSISAVPVKLHHHARSDGSCLGARTVAPGRGRIIFANGAVVPYRVEFQATGTEVDFTFTGRHSGGADGHGSFLTARTPADTALKCARGGNRELPMDLSLKTSRPMAERRTHHRRAR